MTKNKHRRSFKSGDMIVFPGSGPAPRLTLAYAGRTGHVSGVPDLPQKMRKLLRAIVAFNAKKG